MAAKGGNSHGRLDAIFREADLPRMWGGGTWYHRQISSQTLAPKASEALSILFVSEDAFFLKRPTFLTSQEVLKLSNLSHLDHQPHGKAV